MNDAAFPEILEVSRQRLLDEIPDTADVTLVRVPGNMGDELIGVGTRALLANHVVCEIVIEELATARGELALITGGGAWCRAFNDYMPEVLDVAERRFDRVVVLPSSFETTEDRVRAALRRTRATIFARE